MIQVFQPTLGPAEQDAAAAVLASGWIGFGPKVLEFERSWAAHIGVPVDNVVSVSCATAGLYEIFEQIALHTPWIDHHVIVPAIAFIGIANAVRESGLGLTLCDVDRHTLNPTAEIIKAKMDELSGEYSTRAVCIQHYGGVPSDLGPIAALCQERGVLLVEDCACAPLSFYDSKRAGTFGDFAVWSFDAMKIITTAGEGGMVYCKDAAVAEQIRKATRLGQDNLSGQSNSGPRWWEFQVAQPGRKAMMNDLQAAVGLVQLGRLQEFVEQRSELSYHYDYRFYTAPPEWVVPYRNGKEKSSHYSYWIQCDRRDELATFLRSREIYSTMRYHPINRAYNWPSTTPNAEWAADRTLLLPLHANLSRANVDYICDTIGEFFSHASS